MSIIRFPETEAVRNERAWERRKAICVRLLGARDLAVALGTPDQWLETALIHLKEQTSGRTGGAATVSVAALHLVITRLEELEGGPTRGDAA